MPDRINSISTGYSKTTRIFQLKNNKALTNGEFGIRPSHEDIATGLMGRKTFTGGALNMGLVASNTDQLLTVITSKRDLDGLDLAKIVLISFSLTVQVSKLETVFKNYRMKKI